MSEEKKKEPKTKIIVKFKFFQKNGEFDFSTNNISVLKKFCENPFFKEVLKKDNELHYEFIPEIFESDYAVPDCKRFSIKEGKLIAFDTVKEITRNVKRVIFILESPHVDEYTMNYSTHNVTKDTFSPLIPAKGVTGKNMKNLLELFIEINDSTPEIDVILINRIPYQTSLGTFLNCNEVKKNVRKKDVVNFVRNNVFKILLEQAESEIDFWNRLTSLTEGCEDIVIVNASTKETNDIDDFHKKLKKRFEGNLNIRLSRYNHPSNWGIKIMK